MRAALTDSPRRFVPLVAAACTLASLASCKEPPPDTSGVGPYVLGRTKLVDGEVNARCQPNGDVTWCFGSPEIKIGDQTANVDLYFRGKEKDAPLVELVLSVRGCDAHAADLALGKAMGAPTESAGKQRIWARRSAFVLAQLPAAGSTCVVSFVDPKDAQRIADLRAGK